MLPQYSIADSEPMPRTIQTKPARPLSSANTARYLSTSAPSRITPDASRCAHCGDASLQLKHVTRSFGRGAGLLVIESIPLWSCQRCGESYFTAQTMHEIERIKALRQAIVVERPVPVVAFAEAA